MVDQIRWLMFDHAWSMIIWTSKSQHITWYHNNTELDKTIPNTCTSFSVENPIKYRVGMKVGYLFHNMVDGMNTGEEYITKLQ